MTSTLHRDVGLRVKVTYHPITGARSRMRNKTYCAQLSIVNFNTVYKRRNHEEGVFDSCT
jgi:hypothetical protein